MRLLSKLTTWLKSDEPVDIRALAAISRAFEAMDARQRVEQALEQLPGSHVVTSSFGAQSAVMLHMVTHIRPDIPIVLVDTGYLFPETYRFIDMLTDRLSLNLKVYRSQSSPAWQESRFGKLWDQGIEGIDQYNKLNKVEPMDRAMQELGAETWFSGIRRVQSESRARTAPIEFKRGRYKVHPIFDWNDRDVGRYLKQNDLPYHPLWDKGYVSIGDWHTTRSLQEAGGMDGLRFFGLKRECGLHEG
jgi:phosphoadenosine phosphosulfate reductase